MHELGITLQMIDAISTGWKGQNNSKVKKVVMEIGALTAVLPDSIQFCFDLCSRGTVVEGADLKIEMIAAAGTCRDCQEKVETSDPYPICHCGSANIEWFSGQELKIRELEVV